jgi:hypothetical protein
MQRQPPQIVFIDFEYFQSLDDSIHDGEPTPIAGSWTSASGSMELIPLTQLRISAQQVLS